MDLQVAAVALVAEPFTDPAVEQERAGTRHRANEVVPFAGECVQLGLRRRRRQVDGTRRNCHRSDYSPARSAFLLTEHRNRPLRPSSEGSALGFRLPIRNPCGPPSPYSPQPWLPSSYRPSQGRRRTTSRPPGTTPTRAPRRPRPGTASRRSTVRGSPPATRS